MTTITKKFASEIVAKMLAEGFELPIKFSDVELCVVEFELAVSAAPLFTVISGIKGAQVVDDRIAEVVVEEKAVEEVAVEEPAKVEIVAEEQAVETAAQAVPVVEDKYDFSGINMDFLSENIAKAKLIGEKVAKAAEKITLIKQAGDAVVTWEKDIASIISTIGNKRNEVTLKNSQIESEVKDMFAFFYENTPVGVAMAGMSDILDKVSKGEADLFRTNVKHLDAEFRKSKKVTALISEVASLRGDISRLEGEKRDIERNISDIKNKIMTTKNYVNQIHKSVGLAEIK